MKYAVVLCGPCASDCCEDCQELKAVIRINGEEFTGKCQCGHSRLRRGRKSKSEEQENGIRESSEVSRVR